MEISAKLRDLRARRGVTQKEVYTKTGIGMTGYQAYERGSRSPRIEQLIALADYFDVSVDYLIGRSDDPQRH